MKDCCKTGNEPEQSKLKKYFKWVVYLLLAGIIVFVVIKQFTSSSS